MLECSIPAFPQEYGREFLIFRWGTGYATKPSGPRAPFIHRENETPVTELEIRKTLKILDIPEEIFWGHVDGCMIELTPLKPVIAPQNQAAQPLPSDPPAPPKK